MSTTSWTRKLAFLAIIWTVSLIVLLVLAELVLRLTSSDWDGADMMNVVRDRTYTYDASGLYPGGQKDLLYRRDKYGLRDDCASPADIDIVTIGGSTTDQRMVPFESTFQEVMERELSKAAGKPLCVANAGVDGHSSYGHVETFRSWLPLIPGLKPKIFLFYIGINDANVIDEGPSSFDRRSKPRSSLRRLKVVQLAYWAGTAAFSFYRRPAVHERWAFDPAEYDQTTLNADTRKLSQINAANFRGRLRTMLAAAHAYGAQVVCVTQPSRMILMEDGKAKGLRFDTYWNPRHYGGLDFDYSQQTINQVMRDECGPHRLFDLYKTRFPPTIYYDAYHTTPEGSQMIGNSMARWIERSDLMPLLSSSAVGTQR